MYQKFNSTRTNTDIKESQLKFEDISRHAVSANALVCFHSDFSLLLISKMRPRILTH